MNNTIVRLLQDWGVNPDSMYWLYWCFVVLGIAIVIYIVKLYVVKVNAFFTVIVCNIKHNAIYQQVNDHSQMVTLTHLTPEDTPSDTAFVPLYDILERLRKEFPTFAINRSTDRSVGRCLHALGYEHKKTSKGIFYKIKAIQP